MVKQGAALRAALPLHKCDTACPMSLNSLSILFQDENLVAIDKPSGLLVHKTELSRERVTAMSILRDQLGQWVYPAHRLDRATSGVLVFALSPEAARAIGLLFQEKKVFKAYYAIVRGHMADEGVIDHPLRESEDHERVPAVSRFKTLRRVELPHAVGRYATARYSLVRVETDTGRLHQVRKHLCSVFHPIVGDTTYGDGRHNKFFRAELGQARLFLHARDLRLTHPYAGAALSLESPWPAEYLALFDRFGWGEQR